MVEGSRCLNALWTASLPYWRSMPGEGRRIGSGIEGRSQATMRIVGRY